MSHRITSVVRDLYGSMRPAGLCEEDRVIGRAYVSPRSEAET